MLKKIAKNLTLGLLGITFCLFPLLSLSAQETTSGTYDFREQSGLNKTASRAGYDNATPTSVEDIISTIIFAALGLLGVVFLGFVMYGAFTWMTALGNSEQVGKANKMVMSALFGFMITLSAYVISYFLISYFWK